MERYVLSFRARAKGGPVTDGALLKGRIDKLQQHDRITMLTHGYNVQKRDGIHRLRELAVQLPALKGSAVVSLVWPGDNFLGGLAYPWMGKAADDTANRLAQYVWDHGLQDKTFNFVSHSLGGRVVMEIIRNLPSTPVDTVCLMAAALDNSCLSPRGYYRKQWERVRRIAVLASRSDTVLSMAYPAGDLTHFVRDRDNPWDLALGWAGPRPRNPAEVEHFQIDENYDRAKARHGDYLPNFEATGKTKEKQQAAARYANDVLAGTRPAVYDLRGNFRWRS